ncbi:MAG: hypothetical protein D9C04_05360 [Nitrosopumilus sp. B06]|nr:MAG: hypothetical protein EB828_06385 [Nitrosopumilus sp. D6]RNJ79244.1 MAG: hypothetical protein D9C04_05360 [Nitrosopumilus sp. B06]
MSWKHLQLKMALPKLISVKNATPHMKNIAIISEMYAALTLIEQNMAHRNCFIITHSLMIHGL